MIGENIMNVLKKISLVALITTSTTLVGCDKFEHVDVSMNNLDFALDFFKPDIENTEAIQEEKHRPYTPQQESKVIEDLVDKRKVDMLLQPYMKELNPHLNKLSPSGRRLVMRELFQVMDYTEKYYNAQYDAYSTDIYQLVQKKKTLDIFDIKKIAGKNYLTDLFKESKKNYLILVKDNYVENYGIEVNYTYMYDRYSRFLEDDHKLKLRSMLYDSQQYNVEKTF